METWTREGVLPDYDMDTDDEEWLEDYNSAHKKSPLDSDALELAMAFVLGGRAADLDEMHEIRQHAGHIAQHTADRLERDGEAYLLPSCRNEPEWGEDEERPPTYVNLDADGEVDDDHPYACFVPYDADEEPMSKPSRSPRARPVTPKFRAPQRLPITAASRRPRVATSATATTASSRGIPRFAVSPPPGDRQHMSFPQRPRKPVSAPSSPRSRTVAKRVATSPVARSLAGKTKTAKPRRTERRIPLRSIRLN
jgi:hypothetical protein